MAAVPHKQQPEQGLFLLGKGNVGHAGGLVGGIFPGLHGLGGVMFRLPLRQRRASAEAQDGEQQPE